jgi:Tocopherol cyclase
MTSPVSPAGASGTHEAHATERDNARVWRGQPGHYEVWYLTFNHRPSRTGFWIRYTLEAPCSGRGDPYAQLWFACFDAADPRRNFAINRRLPIASMEARAAPFEVRVGDATLTHASARGSLEGAGHSARWDLGWTPARRTHLFLPGFLHRSPRVSTHVLSPNLDVALRGSVEVDGHGFALDAEPGGQTHLWGRKHANAWAWGHCNAFEGGTGTALEALTVRVRPLAPSLTFVTLVLDGETLEVPGLADLVLNRGRMGTARYELRAHGSHVRIEGGFSCRPEDMVVAEYADPDGEPSCCANTEVGDLRLRVHRRSGWLGRWVEQVRVAAPRCGHFEIGGRSVDPAIPRRHVTV